MLLLTSHAWLEPTILTSGIILITAGCIIGQICSVFYIADIGALLSRGALISVLLILTLLPALLALCDKWITKASQKADDPGNAVKRDHAMS